MPKIGKTVIAFLAAAAGWLSARAHESGTWTGLAQLVGGIAVLSHSQTLTTIAQTLPAIGDGISQTGTVSGGLLLAAAGLLGIALPDRGASRAAAPTATAGQ